MKNILFIVLFSLIQYRVSAQTKVAFDWPDGKKAGLSLSFDDARASHVEVGLLFFKETGTRVTWYVVPPAMESRLEKWKEMVQDGHEIGNHTMLHPCSGNFEWSRSKALEHYSLESMRVELEEANHRIENLLGVKPVSFAYTCGQTFVGRGSEIRSYTVLIDEMFESGRGWLNESSNDPTFVDFAQVQGVEMDGKNFEKDIKPLIDDAIKRGTWLVLAGHDIGSGGRQTTTTSMLEELIQYANDPANGIWLAPVGEIASYIRSERTKQGQELMSALTFYQSFDQGLEADFAKGNKQIFTSPTYSKTGEAKTGILTDKVHLVKGQGRFGDGLYFEKKVPETIFYEADKNVHYEAKPFSGTISFWLRLDPEKQLEPGYCDPVQITDAGYNDAAFWVDFSDKNPRLFRMGVFGDLKIWNPNNINPDNNPAFMDRLVVAKDRPFGEKIWTHIAIVYDQINNAEKATATFYVNGKLQGSRSIKEAFNWDSPKSKIFLGLNYVGCIDELAIFNKALDHLQINFLFQRDKSLGELLSSGKNQY